MTTDTINRHKIHNYTPLLCLSPVSVNEFIHKNDIWNMNDIYFICKYKTYCQRFYFQKYLICLIILLPVYCIFIILSVYCILMILPVYCILMILPVYCILIILSVYCILIILSVLLYFQHYFSASPVHNLTEPVLLTFKVKTKSEHLYAAYWNFTANG